MLILGGEIVWQPNALNLRPLFYIWLYFFFFINYHISIFPYSMPVYTLRLWFHNFTFQHFNILFCCPKIWILGTSLMLGSSSFTFQYLHIFGTSFFKQGKSNWTWTVWQTGRCVVQKVNPTPLFDAWLPKRSHFNIFKFPYSYIFFFQQEKILWQTDVLPKRWT